MQVANAEIVTGPAVYEGPAGAMVAFTSSNGLRSNCSNSSLTVLKITSDSKNPLSIAWCAPLAGSGAPIVTTSNGSANPIFWVTGAENDNELHGFNALTGRTVFSGAGTTMQGLRHFGTLIAANRHLYVGADNTVYAFAF
jgi:hypothetical protein